MNLFHVALMLLVVFCELYVIVAVIGIILGLLYAPWRAARWYPFAPTLWPGSIIGLLVAITIVIVGKAYGLGF
jgi:hypothetical protein